MTMLFIAMFKSGFVSMQPVLQIEQRHSLVTHYDGELSVDDIGLSDDLGALREWLRATRPVQSQIEEAL